MKTNIELLMQHWNKYWTTEKQDILNGDDILTTSNTKTAYALSYMYLGVRFVVQILMLSSKGTMQL